MEDSRFARLTAMYGETKMELAEALAQIQDLDERLKAAQADLTTIRALMGRVSVYEGMADVSPLVLMVSDLVADHAELERRIDQIVMICRTGDSYEMADGILKAARGGSKTPDTPEGL